MPVTVGPGRAGPGVPGGARGYTRPRIPAQNQTVEGTSEGTLERMADEAEAVKYGAFLFDNGARYGELKRFSLFVTYAHDVMKIILEIICLRCQRKQTGVKEERGKWTLRRVEDTR